MNHRCFSLFNHIIYEGVITWSLQPRWLGLRHVLQVLTWQMPFFCRFAVWCYSPRSVRRLCWNESSKSYGKSCWTPSREQLFCLHWVTRVWVWLIISLFLFSITLFFSQPVLHLPPLLHLSLSHFLHLFGSLMLPHNTQITVQEMKQHGISKSSHTRGVNW